MKNNYTLDSISVDDENYKYINTIRAWSPLTFNNDNIDNNDIITTTNNTNNNISSYNPITTNSHTTPTITTTNNLNTKFNKAYWSSEMQQDLNNFHGNKFDKYIDYRIEQYFTITNISYNSNRGYIATCRSLHDDNTQYNRYLTFILTSSVPA